MRLLMINLLASALVLFSAGFASAYELRLVATTPTLDLTPGAIVSYDLFLDTQGDVGMVLFSASVTYDPTVLQYEPGLSDNADYYPLYYPKTGVKPNIIPATWLSPVSDPPGLWPVPPAGLEQINIDFIEANLQPLGVQNNTATNEWLTTLTFTAIGAEGSSTPLTFGFDNGGNIFNIGNIDVSGDVSQINTAPLVTMAAVPEPTTALLVGLGLVGLGVSGRRRA